MTDWGKQEGVYRTGWHTVENLAEDADDNFFQSCPAQVCTATIVFRRHRWFRLIKNWAWVINHVAGDGASPSVLYDIDMLESCIESDGWFQGGLFEAPLYPLKPGVSRGPPGLSGGPGPLGPPHNSTTGYDWCDTIRRPVVQLAFNSDKLNSIKYRSLYRKSHSFVTII